MIRQMDDEEVSEAAVEFELKRLVQFYSQHMPPRQLNANMEEFRRRAREQAIGVRLLIREARRVNIAVSDDEVEDMLEQVVEQAGGEDAFFCMLDRQNITEDLLRESLRDSKRVDRLIHDIVADIPQPTDKEIRAYYDDTLADFEQPERRRAQHI